MDSISDSNVIVWLFLGIFLFYLFAVIFTLGIWVQSEKITNLFYCANVIITIIILFFNIEIVFFSVSYEPDFINFLVYGKLFTIVGIIMLCGSIIFHIKNHKILRNSLINISTIGGLVLLTYLAQIKY